MQGARLTIGDTTLEGTVQDCIAFLQTKVGESGTTNGHVEPTVTSNSSKRRISAAGRARIAAAQKRRWAEARKGKAGAIKGKVMAAGGS